MTYDSVSSLFDAAKLAEKEGNVDEAIALYSEVIEKYPDSLEAGVAKLDIDRIKGAETRVTLEVLPIFREAINLPIKHMVMLTRITGPLLLVPVLLFIFATYWSPIEASVEIFGGAGVLLYVVASLLLIVPSVLSIVAGHRIFILGEESMAQHGILWWSSRETRFVGWCIAVALLIGLLNALAVAILAPLVIIQAPPTVVGLLGWLVFLPVGYVLARWSLVLPATAVDERPSLDWAWHASRGVGLRLLVLIVFLPFVMDLAVELIPEVNTIALTIAWLYVAAVEIALLSLSYRELAPRRSMQPTPTVGAV